jgi:hypothetical protein
MKVEVEYDGTPPSYNTYQRRHWSVQARLKKEWQGIFEVLLMEQRVPRDTFTHCTARAVLRFPTLQRRDAGNYQTPIEKALGDALVNGGWLPDDTHAHFRFDSIEVEPERGLCRTVLHLEFG